MHATVNEFRGNAEVLAGDAGLSRDVSLPQLAKPDLAERATWGDLAACMVHLPPRQAAYLCSLTKSERVRLARLIMKQKPAAVVVSGGTVCAELLDAAESAAVPLLRSGNVPRIARLLAERIPARISKHGVLVEIFGLGTLIIGESAIGKSEAALDLVLRGHRLVADDVVMLEKTGTLVTGSPTDIGTDLLEIRGLGIINVRALYGESAVAGSTAIRLVVELEEWKEGAYYSLLGIRETRYHIFNVSVSYLKLPVKPGRNMATLIEVAARNQMMKDRGLYTARDLNRKLRKRLAR